MIIETLAIGDEILTGRISDTNSTFVAEKLFEHGFSLSRQTVVPDNETIIIQEIRSCSDRADVVIAFGGLGPTTDDRTVECLAKVLKCEIVEDPKAKEFLVKRYKERGREVTAESLKQSLIPKDVDAIDNYVGLAPGMRVEIGKCTFYFLPGVPREMYPMFSTGITNEVLQKGGKVGGMLQSKTFRCIGIPEAKLQNILNPVEDELSANARLGYRTSFPENHAIVYVEGNNASDRKSFEDICENVRRIVSPWCYSEGGDALEVAVMKRLKEKRLTITLVESCTGGLAINRLTRVPGSSDNVWGGYVSYQSIAKHSMLGVQIMDPVDAVSKKTSFELAKRAKDLSGCALSAAITGYMGPQGGTDKDPIGTIYCCVIGSKTVEEKITLPNWDRSSLQWAASSHLLNLIRRCAE